VEHCLGRSVEEAALSDEEVVDQDTEVAVVVVVDSASEAWGPCQVWVAPRSCSASSG